MQRVVSTYLYVNQKLSTGLLSELAAAGIGGVEVFCDRGHFDYRSPEQVRALAEWFRDHPLQLHAVHSPTSRDFSMRRESRTPISISDAERVRRLDAVDEVKRSLEVAEQIPFRFLTQHLGASREESDPRRLEAAFNSLEHLAMFAKQRGVTIAIENTPGSLGAPATLRQFIHDTHLSDLRLCFDTGHAHMEEGVVPSFETMRDLVVTTHIHDNKGEKDDHLLPYEGTIDWAAALQAMSHAPGAPGGLAMVLEMKDSGARAWPASEMVEVFERFEGTAAAARAR
jgi:sugar phosphate isomerase/epimerase